MLFLEQLKFKVSAGIQWYPWSLNTHESAVDSWMGYYFLIRISGANLYQETHSLWMCRSHASVSKQSNSNSIVHSTMKDGVPRDISSVLLDFFFQSLRFMS